MSFTATSPQTVYVFDAGAFSQEIPDYVAQIKISCVGSGGCGGVDAGFAAGGGGAGACRGTYDVLPGEWTSASGLSLTGTVGAAADASDGEDTTLDAITLNGVSVSMTAGGGNKAVTLTPGVGGTASGAQENVAGVDGDDFSINDAPGQGGASGIYGLTETPIGSPVGQGGQGSTSAPGGSGADGQLAVEFFF